MYVTLHTTLYAARVISAHETVSTTTLAAYILMGTVNDN